MPAPGDQHKPSASTTNPFDDSRPQVSAYTAQEIRSLQSKLDRQLGPEYISTRPGAGGGKVHYITAEKAINLANEVFGFNGWSSSIQNVQVDFVDENQNTGKISLGLAVICRVTLKDGTYHEDIGFGSIENCKGKAAAFEKARKEGATDALKRALKNFGKVLGGCLYDKDYLTKVTKIKVAPGRWDPANLHRHSDFVVEKKEPVSETLSADKPSEISNEEDAGQLLIEHEDEFGGDIFYEMEVAGGHPDEVVLHADSENEANTRHGMPSAIAHQPVLPQRPPENQLTRTALQSGPPSAPNTRCASHFDTPDGRIDSPLNIRAQVTRAQAATTTAYPGPQTIAPAEQKPLVANRPHIVNPVGQHSAFPNPPRQQPGSTFQSEAPPIGFTHPKAVEMLNGQEPPPPNISAVLPRFNPNAESPSIRRTNGINHATSAPITRQIANGGSAYTHAVENTHIVENAPIGTNAVSSPRPSNFVNPAGDVNRKIGMPGGGMPSPLSNRVAYKPPGPVQGKRHLSPAETVIISRAPLADVDTNVQLDVGVHGAKRPRLARS